MSIIGDEKFRGIAKIKIRMNNTDFLGISHHTPIIRDFLGKRACSIAVETAEVALKLAADTQYNHA